MPLPCASVACEHLSGFVQEPTRPMDDGAPFRRVAAQTTDAAELARVVRDQMT